MKRTVGFPSLSLAAAAILSAGVAGLVPSQAADANSIGLQFTGSGSYLGTPITSLAGAVAQTNWNEESTPTAWQFNVGGTANANEFTVGSSQAYQSSSLVDNTNTATGAIAIWSNVYSNGSNFQFYEGNSSFGAAGFTNADPNQAGDNQLYSASLRTPITSSPYTTAAIQVSNIPYTQYNVYVYFGGSSNTASSGLVNLNGTLSTSSTPTALNTATITGGTTYYSSDSYQLPTLTQATATSSTSATAGNYAEFTGVTGSSFSAYVQATNTTDPRSLGMVGIQIVPVPEPATLGIMALMGAGILLVGRKRKDKNTTA